jgi:hypothetical protein
VVEAGYQAGREAIEKHWTASMRFA